MFSELSSMLSKYFRLTSNQSIMKYLRNTLWMFLEQFVKIISAVLVGVYIARFLGPESFGLLTYSLAVVAIFMAFSRIGMDSILVRDIAKYPEQSMAYMSTAFVLMFIMAVLCLLAISVLTYFFESDQNTKIYIWIISLGLLFQAALVIDYNFQAQVKAKYSSIAKSIALVISSLFKIYLVEIEANIVWFAVAFLFDYFVIALSLLLLYVLRKQPIFFGFKKALAKSMLKSAWPMMLAAVAAVLYMRVDQVMIKNMLDAKELGIYSAATKIYEGWIVVPYIISVSLLPAIVSLKLKSTVDYEKSLTKLFVLVFWSGFIVAVITTIFSEEIISHTFGESYSGAAPVLVIVMWTAAFVSMGGMTARYLTAEGLERKIAQRTFIALILNVILNYIFIPRLGIKGAAYSTFMATVFSNYILDYLDRDLRTLFMIKTRAMILKF